MIDYDKGECKIPFLFSLISWVNHMVNLLEWKTKVMLVYVKMNGVEMERVELNGTKLNEVDSKGAKLNEMEWNGAKWRSHSIFYRYFMTEQEKLFITPKLKGGEIWW